MDERKARKEREVNHDGGDDRRRDAAEHSLDALLRTDARREAMFAERPADVIRAGIAEPDDDQQKEDELRTVARKVFADADQRPAEHADIERGHDRNRARRQRLLEHVASAE